MLRAMNNSNIRSSAAALAAAALLLLPGAAFAREGAASGGGKKTTPTYFADCGAITPTNSPHLFGGRDSGLMDFDVTNCGQFIGSYDIDERGTAMGVSPLDPLATLACTTPTATAGHLTIKAGDTSSTQVAALPPYCATSIWGT